MREEGGLLLLEEPTSPKGHMVTPASEGRRAVARHVTNVHAAPVIVVIGARCGNAGLGWYFRWKKSIAVAAVGHLDKVNTRLSGPQLWVLVLTEGESAGRMLLSRERCRGVSGGGVCVSHRRCGSAEEHSGEGGDLEELHGDSFERFLVKCKQVD